MSFCTKLNMKKKNGKKLVCTKARQINSQIEITNVMKCGFQFRNNADKIIQTYDTGKLIFSIEFLASNRTLFFTHTERVDMTCR